MKKIIVIINHNNYNNQKANLEHRFQRDQFQNVLAENAGGESEVANDP